MTHSDLARLEGLVANIGPLPIDPIWMYEVIRHAQRNMDFDVAEGFCEPDRYAGSPIGELINTLPALLARVRELELEAAEFKASAAYRRFILDRLQANVDEAGQAVSDFRRAALALNKDNPDAG